MLHSWQPKTTQECLELPFMPVAGQFPIHSPTESFLAIVHFAAHTTEAKTGYVTLPKLCTTKTQRQVCLGANSVCFQLCSLYVTPVFTFAFSSSDQGWGEGGWQIMNW